MNLRGNLNGNTHVTITWACLLVDSRSQRLQAFTYILIRYHITLALFWGPRLGPPKISFPTHPLRSFLHRMPHLFTHPSTHCLFGRGGSMEGVHPPPPSSFAPRRSRPTVDFFGAPHRLPTRTDFNIYWRTAPTSTR